jgi:hypothetical protein
MTSSAKSDSRRSWLKAQARSRMSASVMLTPSWTRDDAGRIVHHEVEIGAELQILGHRAGGGAPAWASSTHRAVTSASTSASACWPPLSEPDWGR